MYSYCISVSGCIDSDIHPALNDLPNAAKPFGSYSERSLSPLAQAVAVCETSVQHLRGTGKVCETIMQRLHGPFTVCEMTMQHLHSPFTVCGGTMQHLRGPFTVCETTMQHLRGLFTVCETIMQALHSLFGVSEMTMQALHSLFTVCDFGSHAPGECLASLSQRLCRHISRSFFCPFLIADHKRVDLSRVEFVTGADGIVENGIHSARFQIS